MRYWKVISSLSFMLFCLLVSPVFLVQTWHVKGKSWKVVIELQLFSLLIFWKQIQRLPPPPHPWQWGMAPSSWCLTYQPRGHHLTCCWIHWACSRKKQIRCYHLTWNKEEICHPACQLLVIKGLLAWWITLVLQFFCMVKLELSQASCRGPFSFPFLSSPPSNNSHFSYMHVKELPSVPLVPIV